MNIEDAGDLFFYELKGAYYIETKVAEELAELADQANIETLDEQADESFREDVHDAFRTHHDQTETHVGRLEEVFDALDRQPETHEIRAVDEIFAEKEQFNNVVLNDAARPLYYLDVGAKVEQLEVQCYDSLLQLAEALDLDDGVVDTLAANREEDEEARRRMTELAEGDGADEVLAHLVDETTVV
ncbi:YciE/YciF ferroxidase family protein [Halopelagius longus]|uniref:DUF892 family protein n=1 Tax=Halopelagius longus TaxID=1236180 RepID=A0A1H1GLF1_9EURY|nr:DUF892 family protein [Halopelagius longus]RDI69671.1 DUF892 family protein [Halopelagius longus]SDR14010.1 Ferritin-like metal-binding protein YciE [Halopelagius longus]